MSVIRCLCGVAIEGDDAPTLVAATRAHNAAAHPQLAVSDARIAEFVATGLRLGTPRPRVERLGEVTIRALTPDLLGDWLRFFEGEAFADNPVWASCYCAFYYANVSQAEWQQRGAAENRAEMCDRIDSRRAQGYLAYVDGQPAGWCNAAPRPLLTGYDRWEEFRNRSGDARVGTIACFVIAPPYRRHGLARRLLDAAVDGFREQGLVYAEAFPPKQPTSDAQAYHGPPELYRAAGFALVREFNDLLQMRKALQP